MGKLAAPPRTMQFDHLMYIGSGKNSECVVFCVHNRIRTLYAYDYILLYIR